MESYCRHLGWNWVIFQAPFEDFRENRYVPWPCVSTPASRTATPTKKRPLLCWATAAASSTCSWLRWRCIRIVWRVKKQWSQRHICRFIDTWDANNFRFWLIEDFWGLRSFFPTKVCWHYIYIFNIYNMSHTLQYIVVRRGITHLTWRLNLHHELWELWDGEICWPCHSYIVLYSWFYLSIYIYFYKIYICCICNYLYIYMYIWKWFKMEKHPEPWSHLVFGDCQGTTRLITDRMMKPIFDLEEAHVVIPAKWWNFV